MKKIIIIAIVLIFNSSIAQTDVVNELLSINYNYKNFKLKSNVKQMTYKRGYFIGMGYLYSSFYTYDFNKNGNLVKEHYHKKNEKHSNINTTETIYSYTKTNKLDVINVVFKGIPKENYIFQYDKKDRLVKIIYTDLKDSSKMIYTIEWKKNKPIKYRVLNESGNTISESSQHQFDKKKNLIHYSMVESGEEATLDKVFNKNNLVTKEVYKYVSDPSSNFTLEYIYNSHNDVVTEIDNGTKTSFEYEKYDENDNWLEKINRFKKQSYNSKREFTYYE